MASERGKRPAGKEPTTVQGISFWRAVRGAMRIELNTQDDLAVDGRYVRWRVAPVVGGKAGQPIESASPEVRRYLERVLTEKERLARGYLVRTRPVPKPARRNAQGNVPAHAPVPCPVCRPGADAYHPGEAWPDCMLCNGEGVVTARQSAAWREEHD